MSHAKLSPSAAERWMTCPGSVVLSKDMPQKSSAFAEEGTLAHELAEKLLTVDAFRMDAPFGMLDNVMVYVDHVNGLGGVKHVEQRVKVTDNLWGTADAVVWQADDKHLHIVDLKYGAGVPVEVIGNLQLKIYALATLLTFGYPAEKVTATIVQPRCPHSDGPVRSITFDVVDLVDFHADLVEAIQHVDQAFADVGKKPYGGKDWNDFHLTPSDKGCRWCLASPICPKLKGMAQEAAKKVFAKGLPYDPAELAATLDTLPLLEGWIKNVREFAYEEAERGTAIPDWKLVEKRATRKWRGDEATIAQELHKCGLNEEIFERKLITPAAAEKLLPKEQRALLDELCVKESSGHTLVHSSDKRQAIKVDAKSAFA